MLICLFASIVMQAKYEADPILVRFQRSDDKAEVRILNQEAIVRILSPRGISHAVLVRSGKSWPSKISIRLELKGLESLEIQADKAHVKAAVSMHDGRIAKRQWLGNDETAMLVEPNPMWIDLRLCKSNGASTASIPLVEGWFEFRIPQGILETNPPEITLRWIDFYRN